MIKQLLWSSEQDTWGVRSKTINLNGIIKLNVEYVNKIFEYARTTILNGTVNPKKNSIEEEETSQTV